MEDKESMFAHCTLQAHACTSICCRSFVHAHAVFLVCPSVFWEILFGGWGKILCQIIRAYHAGLLRKYYSGSYIKY